MRKNGFKVRTGKKGGSLVLQQPALPLDELIYCDAYQDDQTGVMCIECTDLEGTPLFSSCDM